MNYRKSEVIKYQVWYPEVRQDRWREICSFLDYPGLPTLTRLDGSGASGAYP